MLEFDKVHALNLGENLEYVDTYVKGKNTKQTVESYRILFRGVNTGKEWILFLGKMENFFGKPFIYRIEHLNDIDFKRISPFQLKNKNYNYYLIQNNPKHVEELFDAWKSSDPMVHVGGCQHSFISRCLNYSWAYRFNNKTF